MRGYFFYKYMNSLFLSDCQKQVLLGLLLRDGSLNNPNAHKGSTENFRFTCAYKAADKAYGD